MRSVAQMAASTAPSAPQASSAGSSFNAPGPSDLSSSFGARHAQVACFSSTHAQSIPAADSLAIMATRAAAVFVNSDSTGIVATDVASIHMLTNQVLVAEHPAEHIRALGDRLANVHPSLQVLQQATLGDGPMPINQFAGAQLSTACTQISTSLAVFCEWAALALRDFICLDDPKSTPRSREVDTQSVMKSLFKGRPLLVTELQIVGQGWGGGSLFASLKVVPLTPEAFLRAKEVLRYLSFAVRLFFKPQGEELDFFAACIRKLDLWHRQRRDIAKAAVVFESILTSLQAATTRHFESISLGGSLLRPRYSERLFTSPDGARALEAFLAPMSISEEVERVVSAQMSAHMGQVARHAAIMGPTYPPTPQIAMPPIPPVPPNGLMPDYLLYAHALMQAGVQAGAPLPPPVPVAPVGAAPGKKARKASAAAASVAATAAAAAAAAVLPPAVVPFQRVNTTGIIGGAPHTGDVTREVMAAFSAANQNKCFHFYRRGACKNKQCRFVH